MTVLTIPQTLPQSALLGAEGDVLAQHVVQSGAIWFAADPAHVMVEGDAVSGWRARHGEVTAQLAAPNEGASRYDLERGAFAFKTGVNCGFAIPAVMPQVHRFTAAVVFATPNGDARSLLALSTGQTRNVIFLSEADGMIFAKDKAGGIGAEIPCATRRTAGWRLAILSFTGREIRLWADGHQAQGAGLVRDMNAPADLFIGCRSNRPGLSKTLGAALIRDIFLWPDCALLDAQDAPAAAALAALHRYHRWAV